MDKIAIIDDEKDIREGLASYLAQNHFEIITFEDGHVLLDEFNKHDFSLVILDVMMPKIDGLELCRALRKKSNVPVIFLSAAGEAFDRILGLEVGADDYISKPFNPREVLVRVKTVLRRRGGCTSGTNHGTIESKDWKISPNKRTITYKDGEEVKFTPAVYELFEYLYQHHGEVVSREQTFEALLKRPFEEFDRTIDIRISRLRKMLDVDKSNFSYIQTVKGSGYLFDVSCHEY